MCRQETDSWTQSEVAASRVPVVASHVAHCCLDGLHVDRLWVFVVFFFFCLFVAPLIVSAAAAAAAALGTWELVLLCKLPPVAVVGETSWQQCTRPKSAQSASVLQEC